MANQWHFNKYQPNGTVNLDEHQTELKPVNGVIGNAIDAVSSIADTVKDKPFIVDTTGNDNKMLVADRLKAIADATGIDPSIAYNATFRTSALQFKYNNDELKANAALEYANKLNIGADVIMNSNEDGFRTAATLAAQVDRGRTVQEIYDEYPEMYKVKYNSQAEGIQAIQNLQSVKATRGIFDSIQQSVWAMNDQMKLGDVGFEMAHTTDTDRIKELNDEMERLQGNLQQYRKADALNPLQSIVGDTAAQAYMMGKQGGKGAIIGGAIGAVIGGLTTDGVGIGAGAVTGAKWGGGADMAYEMYKMSFGNKYLELINKRDANGNKVYSNDEAYKYAMTYAAIDTGIEMASTRFMIKGVGKVAPKAVMSKVLQGATSDTIATFNRGIGTTVAQMAKASVKAGGSELVEEGLQDINEKFQHNLYRNANDPEGVYSVGDMAVGAGGAMLQALPAVIGLGAIGGGVSGIHTMKAFHEFQKLTPEEQQHAIMAEQNRNGTAIMQALKQDASSNKMAKENPELYGKIVQAQGDNVGVSTAYVNVNEMAETEQGQLAIKNMIDSGLVTQEEVSKSIEADADIAVPIGKYAQLSGGLTDETVKALEESTYFTRGGMSMKTLERAKAEVETFNKNLVDATEKKAARVKESIIRDEFEGASDIDHEVLDQVFANPTQVKQAYNNLYKNLVQEYRETYASDFDNMDNDIKEATASGVEPQWLTDYKSNNGGKAPRTNAERRRAAYHSSVAKAQTAFADNTEALNQSNIHHADMEHTLQQIESLERLHDKIFTLADNDIALRMQLSKSGYEVYNKVVKAIGESTDRKQRETAKANALLMAQHADVMAQYMRQMGRGGYTAMDYLRDSVRINMNAKYDNQKGYMQINPNLDLQQKLNIVDLNNLFTNASVLDKKQLKKYIKNLVNTNWNDKNNETIVNIIHSYNVNHIANGAKKPSNKERKIRNTVVHDLNNILNNAVLVETTSNTKKTQNPTTKGEKHKNNIDFYHRLYVPVSLNGNLYVIRLVVEEDKNNIGLQPKLTELYDIYIDKEGLLPPSSANGKSNGSSNPSIITVRDMLENVKQADNPDVYVKEPKDQIQTKEFKKWFGNSKVVNADGTPKVMYHGTPNGNFDTFKKGANYFTENEQYADRYQNPSASSISTGKVVDNPTTHAVYIKMEKPFDTRDSKAREIFEDEFLNQDGGYDEEGEETEHSWVSNGTELNENTGLPDWTDAEDLYHFIKDKGYDYDGIIVDEGGDGGYGSTVVNRGVAYVTFEPNQVKNVKNSGEFDINNPNMYKQSVNGMTEIMSDGERIISIFKTADRSTFLHEMGHVFFDDIQKLASMDNAPKQLLDDWNTLKEWSGWVDGENVDNTKAHEKFARGWESYLRSGEAPTKGLQRVFRQFSKWLTRIYRSVQRLGGEVPSDIKDIMARMIATQDDIENYAHEQALEQFENTKLYQQLSESEQARVQGYIADIKEKAKERVMRKYMKELDNRPIKEWEEVKDDVQVEIEKRLIEEYPIYKEHQRYLAIGDAALVNTQYGNIENLKKAEIEETVATFEDAIKQEMEHARSEFVEVNNIGKSNEQIAEEMLLSNQGQMALTEEEAKLIKQYTNKDLANNWQLLDKLQRLDPNRENLDAELAPIEKAITKAEQIKQDNAKVAKELNSTSKELDKAEDKIEKLKAQLQERINAVRAIRDGGFGTIPKYMNKARAELGDLTLAQASQYKKYQNQAIRDGKNADRALAVNKVEEALEHKQSQMMNQARARVAFENQQRIKKLRTKLLEQNARITRAKNPVMLDPQLRYFYTHMMYQMGLIKRDGLMPTDGFDETVITNRLDPDAGIAGFNTLISMDDTVSGIFNAKSPRTFATLTVNELNMLEELMTGMYQNGRREYEHNSFLTENGNPLSIDYVERDILDKAIETFGEVEESTFNIENSKTTKNAIFNKMANFAESLQQIKTILRRLDGGKGGPAEMYIYDTINRARQHFNERLESETMRLAKNVALYSRKELYKIRNERGYQVGDARNLTKEQVMALALNWGTERNRQRAIETVKANEVEIERLFQDVLDDRDWEFIIREWEQINSFYPERSAVQERMTGNPLKKEEGITFRIGGRTIEGQYYPIMYDPKTSGKSSNHEMEDIAQSFMSSNATFGYGMSATKSRLDKVKDKQLLLSLDVIPRAITESINHITMREAVTDVNTLINRKEFADYITNKLGASEYQYLRQWVRDQWTTEVSRLTEFDNIMQTIKRNISSAVMAGKVSVAIQNVANIPVAMEQLGAARVMRALYRAGVGVYGRGSGRYNETREFVLGKSVMLRERVQTLDKDMRRGLEIGGKGFTIDGKSVGGYTMEQLGEARDAINSLGYSLLSETDLMLSVPIWKDVYDVEYSKLVQKEGISLEWADQRAIELADKAIIDIFGSGDIKDQAGIQRNKGTIANFATTFYTYAGTLWNMQLDGFYAFKDRGDFKKFARVIFYDLFMQAVIMVVYNNLFGSDDDDDPTKVAKSLTKEFVNQSIMGVPFVREGITHAMNRMLGEKVYNRGTSPLSYAVIDKIDDIFTAVNSSKKDWTDVGRAGLQFANSMTGLSNTLTDGVMTIAKYGLTDIDAELEDLLYSVIFDKRLKSKKEKQKGKKQNKY